MTFAPMEAVSEDGYLDSSATKKLADVAGHYTFFGEGDVLFAKITPCFENGKRALASGLCNGLGFGSSEFTVLRPYRNRIDARFLFYLVSTHEFRAFGEPEMLGAGGQKRVPGDYVRDVRVRTPPLDEQRRIAAFLDEQTSRIDALVRQQKELIALLHEKRRSVIWHGVTKGVRHNASLMPSGVEWLGDVPQNWRVTKLKHDAKLESGHTPNRQVDEYWVDCDIPWVSLNDSKTLAGVDFIEDTVYKVNEKGIAGSSARLLPARSVVFTRDATIGLAAITTKPMAVSQHVIAWVCNPSKALPEYMLLVLYAMREELDRYTFGATIKTIGMPDVNELVGAFPDLQEQATIAEHVFSEISECDAAISLAERLIEIMRERRAALISAAVTGQIAISDWHPEEPVEAVV